MQDFGNGRLEPVMGIRDRQLDAAQSASSQLAQELGPKGLGLGGADRHTEYLAPAVAIDGDRNDDGDRHDTTVLAGLHIARIEPKIGPVTFQR